MPDVIANTLSSILLGPPVTHENVTMIPILEPPRPAAEPPYLTLDEALGLGSTEITEVSDSGSVPELRVVNKGDRPVFILDGEELVGAKQNRIVNLSILVPAAATLTIPVSCVEAGRWRARSRAFSSAPRAQFASSRAKRVAQVSFSLRTSGRRESDQAEVWSDIAEKSARLDAHSPTGAMEEIFSKHAGVADRFVETFQPLPDQRGALLLIDGRVVALDVFDRPATLRRLLPKLVRSVAIDALDRVPGIPDLSPALLTKVAEHFLAALSQAATRESPAVGLGVDVRIDGRRLAGAALTVEGSAVHLAAFPS